MPDNKKIRVYHGPENICGIGRYIADWQRENKKIQSDFIVYKDNTNRQNAHKNLFLNRTNPILAIIKKFLFLIKAINCYDIFHFYFGKSLLPLNLDMPILKIFGKKIIMDYLGSDIRLNSLSTKNNPYSHLRPPKNKISTYEWIIKLRMHWQSLWFDKCLAARLLSAHAATSIPLHKIVNNLWINTTLDLTSFHPQFKINNIPVIVHAPTNFQTKGTKYVEKAINELKEEGYNFSYRMFHGVPHNQVLEFIKNEADIVVDQLLSGGFGTLSMEGMSSGKVVCCYLQEDMTKMVPDIPIINCSIDNIKNKLAWLITNPQQRLEIGKKGWQFAKEHYDRNINNEQLWNLYQDILKS